METKQTVVKLNEMEWFTLMDVIDRKVTDYLSEIKEYGRKCQEKMNNNAETNSMENTINNLMEIEILEAADLIRVRNKIRKCQF